MDYKGIVQKWNNEADEFNQWDNLSDEEKIEHAIMLVQGNTGCEYCEEGKTILDTEAVNLAMINWCGETKAKDLHLIEDLLGVFIDRGYLRLVYLDDSQCLDNGKKIKISNCPMCGRKL